MTTLTETLHAGAFIVSEANGFRSRESGILAVSQIVRPGQVLGQLTVGGQYEPFTLGANDGSQVAAGIAIYPAASSAVKAKAFAVFKRDGEVRASDLEWPAGISDADKKAAITALAALGIILR